ncbi:rhodanese-like domain-containing protein [Clostridium thermarum]|uniref:rhodanese-like domain-containing protein n=1 Tax=Clostridium thermarum TaxID=1716543 RepID=UPI0011242C91|nr:rhodanese-like domain-containing protein [Clostridium thermarum]
MFSFFRSNVRSVDVNDIATILGKINLIDVRENYEYKDGHVPTAINIPMDDIIEAPEKILDKSKEYHIICQSGARSSRVCDVLKDKGFNVINVSGGTGRYRGNLDR